MKLLRTQWPLFTVLGTVAVALVTVALDHFRRGSILLSAAVVLAFFLRAMLTDQDAGWLKVRSRAVDLWTIGFFAVGLAIFTTIVPPPR